MLLYYHVKDTDGDGVPDHLDDDDDGDGIPDHKDTDDDGDGIPDEEENRVIINTLFHSQRAWRYLVYCVK